MKWMKVNCEEQRAMSKEHWAKGRDQRTEIIIRKKQKSDSRMQKSETGN